MKNWFSNMLGVFRVASKQKKPARRVDHNRCTPSLEVLEDRCVPSTMSTISSNFNGTAIGAGSSVWFNAAFKASGLGAGPVSVHVTDQAINFNAAGTAYSVNVPDSILNFSAANTVATTSFDAGQNSWITNLPMSWSGNAFLGGATFVAANGLPGGINPVSWTGNFATDTAGVSMKWQWSAAVYTNFGTDYSALNVKPLDSNSATVYKNSDHAGTPEAYKSFVIGGARGGGGSNWTGSYSSTKSVVPAVENFAQPAAISGHVTSPNGPLANVTITLNGFDLNGVAITRTAMTDVNGYYAFINVPPGNYSLTESAASGYNPSSATAGTVDGVTAGTADASNHIGNISLGSGDFGIDYDFFQTIFTPPPV